MPSHTADPTTPLVGRKALVTGAAQRLGRALAIALARAGADVLVHYRSSEAEARRTVADIEALGRRAAIVQADLGDADAVRPAFSEAIDRMGGLDILVNNVGTIAWKRLDEHTPEDWRECLDGTLFATLHASEAALPALRRSGRGRILNILDADADLTSPVPFATAYKIGKRAAFTLTKTMAVTEGPKGVTVNAISPGTLDDSGVKPPLEKIPLGRYGTHADVAGTLVHLASDAGAYVTGTQVKVSGGDLL